MRSAYNARVADLEFSGSVFVAQEPDQLYALVSDVTRTGEWSPVCRSCWWDDQAGPFVGAWFTGHNETPERTWETRCQVVVADPGREFAWEVNNGWVRWGFSLEPENGGTRLTESWRFLPPGIAGFHERYGQDADAQIAQRSEAAHTGIPQTLAAIKKVAEARPD
jgi:hypothetical protein